MDPVKDLVRLLNQTLKRKGVRGLGRLAKIPPQTLSGRRRDPSGWKLPEIKRILDACALNDRLSVHLHGPPTAPVGQRKEPPLTAVIHRQTPKKQPTPTLVRRSSRRHVSKSRRRPK